jgi:hypothetical protein
MICCHASYMYDFFHVDILQFCYYNAKHFFVKYNYMLTSNSDFFAASCDDQNTCLYV